MCVYLLIPSTFKVAHEFGNHVLRIKLHTENTIYWDGGQKKVTAWKEQHLGNAASTSEAIRHARRHDINILDKKVQGFQEDPKPSCQIEDLYSKVDHVLLGMVSPLPLISRVSGIWEFRVSGGVADSGSSQSQTNQGVLPNI